MKKLSLYSSFIFLFLFSITSQSYAINEKKEVSILFLGDSLTEGYGIEKAKSYPMIAAEILKEKGHAIKVINGSVSGSTTASGTSRLKWFGKAKPDYVFLALGGNDALRGIKVSSSKSNLARTIKLAQEMNIKVILAGVLAPPNYGQEYGKAFASMYLDLKKEFSIPTLPFILEGVAGEKKFNQEDGIHPNVEGHKIMGAHVARFIQNILNS